MRLKHSSFLMYILSLLYFISSSNLSYAAVAGADGGLFLLQGQKNNKGKEVVRTEPLFGKELKTVKVKSDKLKGACFYIVSGHGGPDPGAVGKHNGRHLHEDEYAYDVALRLARNLMEDGAEVRIIIQDKNDGIRKGAYLANSDVETCMGEKIPESQKKRLRQRVNKINALYKKDKTKYKYTRAIFLHVDSRSKGTNIDVHFYHSKHSKKGEGTARAIRDTFKEKYRIHNPKRGYNGTVGPHPKGLYVVNNSMPAAVLIELANIKNERDLKRILLESNRQALANWMSEALVKDYKANVK